MFLKVSCSRGVGFSCNLGCPHPIPEGLGLSLPSFLTQFLTDVLPRRQQITADSISLCHPCGCVDSHRFLVSTWSRPSYREHLVSEPASERYLFFCFLSLALSVAQPFKQTFQTYQVVTNHHRDIYILKQGIQKQAYG